MAKKRSRKTTKKKDKKQRLQLNEGVGREITAIVLVAVAGLLVLSIFGIGGSLPEWINGLLKQILGAGLYVVPLLLIFVGWRLFQKDPHVTSLGGVLGMLMVVAAVSGLAHISKDVYVAQQIASDGEGGGWVGYGLQALLFTILNVYTGSIVLVAMLFVGLAISLNARPSSWFSWMSKLKTGFSLYDDNGGLKTKDASLDSSKINDFRPQPEMTINAKVPLVSALSGRNKDKKLDAEAKPSHPADEREALTTSGDPDWKFPPVELLGEGAGEADAGDPKANAKVIQETLESFGIEVAIEEVNIGPTVTQYALRPPNGVKLSRISELTNNLELALAAHPIRVEAPIPGKSAVGIEVPNRKIAVVRLREIFLDKDWSQAKNPLTFTLGRDITGSAILADLAKMPHLLVAGATGSGKSIMINALLMSFLYRNSPADLKLILVDPKQVELILYADIPHLLAPVIVEPDKCISALKWAVKEMDQRYSVLAEHGKRNIEEYNKIRPEERMPSIVIVIDELADMMMVASQEVEGLIVRIAQKARAVGIHLVLATQRPSVNVITGLIKANIPARIALSTVSQVDSRTIIDQGGAEKLLGKGDMLFLAPDFAKPRRMQGVFVDEPEVKSVTDFVREAREPNYNEEVLTQSVGAGGGIGGGDMGDADDDLFRDAAQVVIESGKASASLLQRRLRVGYARAARLIDMLEEKGIVSMADGSRPREVLVSSIDDIMGDEEGAGA